MILIVVVSAIYGVRLFYHQRVRSGAAWDCGFGGLNSRMQDTAEGFGQPIRHLFQPFFAIVRELPSPFDRAPPIAWRSATASGSACISRSARSCVSWRTRVAWLQQGRIATYLLYSFVTLVVLAGARAMSAIDWIVQVSGIAIALAAAPVFLGWVNQCRAWLQNKSAPSLLQPYRGSASCSTRMR